MHSQVGGFLIETFWVILVVEYTSCFLYVPLMLDESKTIPWFSGPKPTPSSDLNRRGQLLPFYSTGQSIALGELQVSNLWHLQVAETTHTHNTDVKLGICSHEPGQVEFRSLRGMLGFWAFHLANVKFLGENWFMDGLGMELNGSYQKGFIIKQTLTMLVVVAAKTQKMYQNWLIQSWVFPFRAFLSCFHCHVLGLRDEGRRWRTCGKPTKFELTQALTDDFLQTLQSQRQFSKSTRKTLILILSFCGKMIKYLGFSSMILLFWNRT